MAEELKSKTVYSLLWSALDKVGVQLVAFVVGIVTARLLAPRDFGLIGALAVFTILSNTLVESGFTAALVRRKSNTDAEYVATFYFNLLLSVVIYGALYVAAPLIADFFKMPELCWLSRFLFVAVVINSFGLIQNVVLTRRLAFKILTKINLISVTVSGICTVLLIVYGGLSYWALAWQQVIQTALKSLLLWLYSDWRIGCRPDFSVIRELFSFSAFLLLTSVVTAVVKYIYNFVIGRLYTVEDLGYYAQSYKYQQIPSSIISATLSSVAYPVLSRLNDERERQMLYFRKLVRLTAFITFPVMLGLWAVAEEFIVIFLTEKWLPVVDYFRVLLLVGVFYPFHVLALNILTVKGFPKLNFALEMVRNGLVVALLVAMHSDIMQMLYGLLIATAVSVVVDMIFIKRKTGFRLSQQVWDVLPYLAIAVLMVGVVLSLSLLAMSIYLRFALQIVVGGAFYLLLLRLLGSKLLSESLEFFKK